MSVRTTRLIALAALACAAGGCFAPGGSLTVWNESYEVKKFEGSSSSWDARLMQWYDQGSSSIELDYAWTAGKEVLFGGLRLKRFEGIMVVYPGVGGRSDGQQIDWTIIKGERMRTTSYASFYAGLTLFDSPSYTDSGVGTEETFAFVFGGDSTGLIPLGKDFALGIGIDGRMDYIAAFTGGWHAEIALNAPKGSRLLEKSKRTTYVAVGYRQWWGIQFLTNRVFASFDGNDSYLLGTEISGVYVRTSIVW
jgi:hypothetical protein